MRPGCTLRRIAFITLAFASPSSLALAQTYSVREIVPPTGHLYTVATGVNTAGTVVGYSYSTTAGSDAYESILPFRWTGGATESIAPLSGRAAGIAYGINSLGETVGTSFNISGASFVSMRAFMDLPSANYGLSSGPFDLGDLGGGASAAYAVNDSGYAVGESAGPDGVSGAFLWLPQTFHGPVGVFNTSGIQSLGTLGGATSAAYGINNLGQVVGGSVAVAGDFKAFLWTPFASAPYVLGMNNLGAAAASADSIAYAVTDDTKAAGYTFTGSANTTARAILFDHGVRTAFAPLPGGSSCGANGINSFGQLVGASSNTSSTTAPTHAFLVSAGKGYDLNSLITSGTGWVLQAATATTDSGYIVGYGTKVQSDLTTPTRAFILAPNFTLQPNTGVPAAMMGGASASGCAVNLDHPVGIDVTVRLRSSLSSVHVPATVVVPAGQTAAGFIITSDPGASGTAVVTASLFGISRTSSIAMTPSVTVFVTGLTLNPTSVLGGNYVTATVTLNQPSPGITVVPLSATGFDQGGMSSTLPSISVADGLTSGSVSVPTSIVPAPSAGIIRATYNGTADAELTINPISVASLTLTKSTVVGTDSVTGKVTLTAKAPARGAEVNLSYTGYGLPTDPIGGVPPLTVTVPAGSLSATFQFVTNPVTTTRTATVYAQLDLSAPVSAILKVNPIGVNGISLSQNYVPLATRSITVTATIERPAPAGGWLVQFTSSQPGVADYDPTSALLGTVTVTVPAGSTTTGPVTLYLNAKGSSSIKAQAPPKPASGAKSKSVSLYVTL